MRYVLCPIVPCAIVVVVSLGCGTQQNKGKGGLPAPPPVAAPTPTPTSLRAPDAGPKKVPPAIDTSTPDGRAAAICARSAACGCSGRGDCKTFYAWPKTVIPEPLWSCVLGHLKQECKSFCSFEWEKSCIKTHAVALKASIDERTGAAALLTTEQKKGLEDVCAARQKCKCAGANCKNTLAAQVPFWSATQQQCFAGLSSREPKNCRAHCQGSKQCSRRGRVDRATEGRIAIAQLCKRSALCGCPSQKCVEHFTSLLAKYPGEEAGYRCAVEQLDCTGLCDSWGRGSPFYATCAQPRLTAARRKGIKSKQHRELVVRLMGNVNQPALREYNRPGTYLYSDWGKPRKPIKRKQPIDVRFVPTPQRAVDKMLEMAQVKPGDVLYDLGCGDGRIVITAAKRFGIKAVGFDLDPRRVQESRANVLKAGVSHLVTIKRADVFLLDLSPASVVTLYLYPWLNVALMPQLRKLKPGSRIVSFKFDMKGARPRQEFVYTVKPMRRVIYQWVVPWQEEG